MRVPGTVMARAYIAGVYLIASALAWGSHHFRNTHSSSSSCLIDYMLYIATVGKGKVCQTNMAHAYISGAR